MKKRKRNTNTISESFSIERRSKLLNDRVLAKFENARFRLINEQMTNSRLDVNEQIDSKDLSNYHMTYIKIQESWPEKPIEKILSYLNKRSKDKIIADMGCGDAHLAKVLPNKVYSFDLLSLDKNVIQCNMSKTPLQKETCDIVVFSLSLMGTNITPYIIEAKRILKPNGTLIIAELATRIPDLNQFLKKMEKIGFSIKQTDQNNNCFWLLIFEKKKSKNSSVIIKLKPYKYKKR